MGLTRKEQKLDTIYRSPDGQYFFTPDGEGRIFFEDAKEAREETGITSRIITLMSEPEDF